MKIFYRIMLLISLCSIYSQVRANDFGEEDDGYAFNDDGDGDGQYDTIYEILIDIMENGLANYDDGVTHITFDENGNVETFNNYSVAELEANPDLLPPEVWEYFETLQDYVQQEQAYQETVQNEWEDIGNYNIQRIEFLEQHFSQNDFRFLPGPNNMIYVYDVHNPTPGPHAYIYPGETNIPMDWPGFVYQGGNSSGSGSDDPPSWGDIDWTLPDYNSMPTEPYNPFDDDWFYWFYGTGGTTGTNPTSPPPPPPPTAITEDPLELDAEFSGIRNYVTPAGTPVVLPPGSKIRLISNVDYDYFPNGALYEFILPDGTKYAARLSFLSVIGGGIAIPPPQFQGFYKVVNNIPDITQPYPFNPGDYPAPDNNGKIRAVRLSVVKNPDGSCKLVREIVEYEKDNNTSGTVGGNMQNVNYGIEYDDKVEEIAATEHPIQCPSHINGPSGNNWTLQQYVQTRGADVANFLRDRLKNNVKIILYDCATNKAQYTITRDGVAQITGTNQDALLDSYNNESFAEPMAIKGCLQNGKWNYDVKLNSNIPVNTKIQPVLNEIKDEIRRQADDEVKTIRGAGAMNRGESIDAGNGEKFQKANMDLLEAIGAIYDVGATIIKEGQMPESIWDRGVRSNSTDANIRKTYDNSAFNMPSALGGGTDQLIDEVTGAVQLVKAGYEFIRHPKKTFDGVWKGIKTLDKDKIGQILSSASGHANYVAGGDRAYYQGGRHGVQAAMIIVAGLKNVTRGVDAVKEAGEEVSGIQKFLPNGTTNNNVSDALENAADNQKIVKNINDEKLLTENLVNGEKKYIGVEKNGNNVDLLEAKNTDFVDENGNVLSDAAIAEALEEGAKDVNLTPNPNGSHKRGQKGGWNKDLNKHPLNPSSLYDVDGFKYHTDAGGRVTKVEVAALQKSTPPWNRNQYQQGLKCNKAKDGIPGQDQGGHLIGAQFGGPGEQINLVPMQKSLNQAPGTWSQMEQEWANTLNGGSVTNIEINIIYGTNGRPTGFVVYADLNGVPTQWNHTN